VAWITEITSYSSYFVVNFGLIFIFLLATGRTPAWRSRNPSVEPFGSAETRLKNTGPFFRAEVDELEWLWIVKPRLCTGNQLWLYNRDNPFGLETLGLVLLCRIIYKIIYMFGLWPKTIWTIRSNPQLHNAKNAGRCLQSLRDNPFRLAETTLSFGLCCYAL